MREHIRKRAVEFSETGSCQLNEEKETGSHRCSVRSMLTARVGKRAVEFGETTIYQVKVKT